MTQRNKQQTSVTSHCTWNGEYLMKLLNSGLTWRQKETTTTLSYKAQCQRYCEIQSRNGFKDQLEYSFYISIKGLNPDAITIWLLERHTEEGLFLPTCQQPDTTPDHSLVSPKYSCWYEKLQDQTFLKVVSGRYFWSPSSPSACFNTLSSNTAIVGFFSLHLILTFTMGNISVRSPRSHYSDQFAVDYCSVHPLFHIWSCSKLTSQKALETWAATQAVRMGVWHFALYCYW